MRDLIIFISAASAIGGVVALGFAVWHHLQLERLRRNGPADRAG